MSSSYYYGLYIQYRNEVNKYEREINKLNGIRNNIAGSLYYDQLGVNNEIGDLMVDLRESVRHDSTFTQRVNNFEQKKEKGSYSDSHLSGAMDNLDSEISRLTTKKSAAEQNRDDAYRDYEDEKEQERQELLDKLFG